MISNSLIQQAWVSKLKSNIAVTAITSDIRENTYKGTGFGYPNIRVKLNKLEPTTPNNTCQIFRLDVTIFCFSEIKSSKQADDLAGVVATQFWSHPFSAAGVKFTAINLVSVIPAYVPDDDMDSWVSEVNLSCLVQSA